MQLKLVNYLVMYQIVECVVYHQSICVKFVKQIIFLIISQENAKCLVWLLIVLNAHGMDHAKSVIQECSGSIARSCVCSPIVIWPIVLYVPRGIYVKYVLQGLLRIISQINVKLIVQFNIVIIVLQQVLAMHVKHHMYTIIQQTDVI